MNVFLESSESSISRGSNDDTYSKPKKKTLSANEKLLANKKKTPSPDYTNALASTLNRFTNLIEPNERNVYDEEQNELFD